MTETEHAFSQPTVINDSLLAFPGDLSGLVPDYDRIPDAYKQASHPMARFQTDLFNGNLEENAYVEAREHIDLNLAVRHLQAINRSFTIKHEHKMSAVAFLADRWLIFKNTTRYAQSSSPAA